MNTKHRQSIVIRFSFILLCLLLLGSWNLSPVLADTTPQTPREDLAQLDFLVFMPMIFKEYRPISPDGNALFLDGVDDYASIPDNNSLALGNGFNDDFTIECFFYVPDQTREAYAHLILKYGNANWGSYGLSINFHTTSMDVLLFTLYISPSSYVYNFYNVDLANGWHHIAAVFDNEHTETEDWSYIYLDGKQVVGSTAGDWTPGIHHSDGPLYIGFPVYPHSGMVEEVRLSDIIRYSGTTYTVPTVPFSPDANTRALWHFDEPISSTVFSDSSNNHNTLTASNGAHTISP